LTPGNPCHNIYGQNYPPLCLIYGPDNSVCFATILSLYENSSHSSPVCSTYKAVICADTKCMANLSNATFMPYTYKCNFKYICKHEPGSVLSNASSAAFPNFSGFQVLELICDHRAGKGHRRLFLRHRRVTGLRPVFFLQSFFSLSDQCMVISLPPVHALSHPA
jgi:hypothetical protein